MATQLADLDRAIRRERDRRTKHKSKSVLPVPAHSAPATAQSRLGLRPPTPARARSRMLALPVDYAVPGPFSVMAQPTANSCWATVFSMMYSWKKSQSMTIETALAEVGERWLNIFRADTGLSGSDKADFVATVGLQAEPPSSLSLERWEQLLRTNGPIWVTTDEAPGKAWAIHARIIIGLHGDGTPEGTSFTIVDPAGGRQYDETIATFIPKYEEEVRRTGFTRIQILYWPADARYAAQKALSVRPPSRSMNIYRPYGRAFDGGATVALAGLGWEIFQAVANNAGDIHWSVQRMEGAKHPWDQKDKYENIGTWQTKTVRVKQLIETALGLDEVSATFELSFRYNGNSVGYVEIHNVGTNDAPFWGMQVDVTIMPDPNAYRINGVEPIAAVDVTFNFRFTHSIRDDSIYVEKVSLNGNGLIERNGRWTQW